MHLVYFRQLHQLTESPLLEIAAKPIVLNFHAHHPHQLHASQLSAPREPP
uniref:Uncharacterized protein n=1 Tax=Arundo donax TaxID=35708 RepID=A0A0A9A8H1_ARUDO